MLTSFELSKKLAELNIEFCKTLNANNGTEALRWIRVVMKRDLDELDAGQLDLMWSCLKLRKEIAYKSDVRALIRNLDAVRQGIVQMTGGEQAQSNSSSVLFSEIGTYVNSAIAAALWLRTTGALDKLMDILPEVSADEP